MTVNDVVIFTLDRYNDDLYYIEAINDKKEGIFEAYFIRAFSNPKKYWFTDEGSIRLASDEDIQDWLSNQLKQNLLENYSNTL